MTRLLGLRPHDGHEMGCADDFRRIQLFVLNGARELRVVSSDAGELKVRVERATRGVRASFGPVEPTLVAFEAGSEFEFLRESRSVSQQTRTSGVCCDTRK